MAKKKLIECSSCGEKFPPEKIYYGDEGCPSEGKPICENCLDEDEPVASFIFSEKEDEPIFITEYRNDTLGIDLPFFRAKWVSTDPWRGYYKVESDNFELIHSDCILYGSEDAQELEKFDKVVEKILKGLSISFCKVISQTSNIFSSGYDLFVEKRAKKKVEGLIRVLKERFRDRERFLSTALTGKNPEDLDEKDKQFIRGSIFIKLGFTPEQTMKILSLLNDLEK